MIYIFERFDLPDYNYYDKMIPLLSTQRYAKVKRLRFDTGKKASICVYLLLRYALIRDYGINEAVEFDFGANEKPYLKNYPQVFFNLSHTQNTAACVISDTETGIDVQKIKAVSKKVAKRVLTQEEYSAFENSEAPDDYFCEIWTVKESFLKKTGAGITKELRDFSACSVTEKFTIKSEDYYCTVCGVEKQVNYVGRDDFERIFTGQTGQGAI